jgi:hypothetical protein
MMMKSRNEEMRKKEESMKTRTGRRKRTLKMMREMRKKKKKNEKEEEREKEDEAELMVSRLAREASVTPFFTFSISPPPTVSFCTLPFPFCSLPFLPSFSPILGQECA